ncbi:MAG: transglutaminase family protein [Tepidisphaeraceae bacterium]
MRYRVHHETRYRYSEPVSLCQNVLRLKPRDRVGQTCLRHDIAITPMPSARSNRADFFGNDLTWVSVEEAHSELSITARSEVAVAFPRLPEPGSTAPWEAARYRLQNPGSVDEIGARQFTFDSPLVPRDAALASFATPSFTPGRPVLEAALDLARRIHDEFVFTPGTTDIDTPVLDVLARRRGVCQDFAHLQIGSLRSIGLAARYVSGYLVTTPPPGQERLVGADASHAWVSVYIPDIGWIDLDPTNNVAPTDGHITLAWARDYADVGPVDGIVVGGGRHSLSVAVDVVPVS